MAKYVAIIVSLIFFVNSVNSAVLEPSADIIRSEDAEEGKYYQRVKDQSRYGHHRRFLDYLVCPNTKTDDNTVEKVSGDPPHMNSQVKVTCDAGKHFTGRSSHKSMVTLTCTALPNPNYEVEWQDNENYQLMYDFNCTSDVKDKVDTEGEFEPAKDTLSIYPIQNEDKDDPQCPDPTPVRGTMKILHGHPFSYGCIVLLTCDPGLVFEDGMSVWNLTCLGLSVLPPKCVWVPMHVGKPICKDDPKCFDPTPVRGTLKVLHGHPFSCGCNVLLTCDPGLVFNDGKSVWNLTCLGLPVQPPTCVWAPVHDGKPVCRGITFLPQEPEQIENSVQDHAEDSDESKKGVGKQTLVAREVNDDPQCPDPTPIRGILKILSGNPYYNGCTVLLTCDPGLIFPDGQTSWNLTCTPLPIIPNKSIWLPQYDGRPACKEPAERNLMTDEETKINTDERESYLRALDINSYVPEEDLDGTFHDNIIENRKNNENQNEVNEELTNKLDEYRTNKSDIEIYDDIINHFENKDYEAEFSEDSDNEDNDVPDFDSEHVTSSEKNESPENENNLQVTTDVQESKPELTENEDNYSQAFPETEDDINENMEEVENYEDEPLQEMTDEENENAQEEKSFEEGKEIGKEIEKNTENEEENETGFNEMEEENESMIQEQEDEVEGEGEEEETIDENEDEENENYREEQHSDYNESNNEETEEENYTDDETIEEQANNEKEEDETVQEAESDEPDVHDDGYNDQHMREVDNYEQVEEIETETVAEELEDSEESNEEENAEPMNAEKSEEEVDEDEYDIVSNVHPLQPPTIKAQGIIYAALKESSMFDKEEEEEEEENEEEEKQAEEEEERVERNEDGLIFSEAEPPGYLEDIQTIPFEASTEQVQTNENDCSLPAETGPCRAYHKRFFYNSNTEECDVFVYGGCEGNVNNFKTLDECVNTCVRKSLNL